MTKHLPSVPELAGVLENVAEARGPAYVNAFLLHLVGYALNMWLGGLIDPRSLSTYFSKVYEMLVEGSFELDKDVIEVMSIVSEGVNEAVYDEVMAKVMMLLKELP
ncbi:MAG: hypothetical protein QXS42_01350 [Zestosphaera sp.]